MTKKTILYTSGFDSTYKPYILAALKRIFNDFEVHYHVLTDRYDDNFEYLKNQIENLNDQEIHLIGHSTGGFLSLSMYRLFSAKITTVHAINPALTLSKTLRRVRELLPEVTEKAIRFYSNRIETEEIANEAYFSKGQFPIHFYVGQNDEVIDIPYLDRFDIDKTFLDFGHRFDESLFDEMCNSIKKQISTDPRP
jgi:predicted esterase YcpF (UPF0227 family)